MFIIGTLLLTGCNASTIDIETSTRLPSITLLEVPFSPQAPFANWDDPYQEACEEMSLIMIHHFIDGSDLTKEQADEELIELTKWEKENGYPEDVTLSQLAEISCKYYKYCTTNLITEVTIDRIKEELIKGNPIIIPAAGRDLDNPYFSGEGPWYHMLVIKGYDKKRFITNDPGTRRGEGYKYEYSVLLNAVHDWTGIKEDIRNGDQIMLVIRP
ncbi:C39 family peptidase [Patescibacteria group bacterium]|nr:C39 family peptidase [Patescibacteria group bacterium]